MPADPSPTSPAHHPFSEQISENPMLRPPVISPSSPRIFEDTTPMSPFRSPTSPELPESSMPRSPSLSPTSPIVPRPSSSVYYAAPPDQPSWFNHSLPQSSPLFTPASLVWTPQSPSTFIPTSPPTTLEPQIPTSGIDTPALPRAHVPEILYQSPTSPFHNPSGGRSNDEFTESSTAGSEARAQQIQFQSPTSPFYNQYLEDVDEVESPIYRPRKPAAYAISFVEKLPCVDLAHLPLHHSDRKCDICHEPCDVIHFDTAECEKAVRLPCSHVFGHKCLLN